MIVRRPIEATSPFLPSQFLLKLRGQGRKEVECLELSRPAGRCGQQGAAYGSRAVAGWEPDMWSARELTKMWSSGGS